jgi:hypothetical protein
MLGATVGLRYRSEYLPEGDPSGDEAAAPSSEAPGFCKVCTLALIDEVAVELRAVGACHGFGFGFVFFAFQGIGKSADPYALAQRTQDS